MISTKGRYALRVLIDIAGQGQDRGKDHGRDLGEGVRVPRKDVARRQGISEKYLQHMARMLVEGGLVVGTSGRGGGYRLVRPAADTSVLMVLEATEGTTAPVACLGADAASCECAANCATPPLSRRHHELTREFFAGVTVADLVGADATAFLRALGGMEACRG
jgi:Rrf2 family protein